MYTNHRVFDWHSQEQFSRLSGDRNPIHVHVDPVAARRTQSGAPIVHGIHILVWMLDSFSQSDLCKQDIKGLNAQFLRPVYVDDEVDIEIPQPTSTAARARVVASGEEIVSVSIEFERTPRTARALNVPCTLWDTCHSPNETPRDQIVGFEDTYARARD